MLNQKEILSTIAMIDQQHLDIRTITMGISLLSCCDPDAKKACDKIYEKITRYAEKLVKTGEDIQHEFGIPIVNKRISVTPMALVAGASETEDYVPFALALDRAAQTCGVNFIGGYSALVQKGMTEADEKLIRSIREALDRTELVCSSINVGSTRAGINMDAVKLMGRIIKDTAARTADRDGLGCAKLVVFCNAVEDNPFMAGAFHGVGEPEKVINVGVSGPGVVHHALKAVKGMPFDVVAETIKKTAFRITRMGQLVAQEASRRLDTPFGIVDLSLAPTPAVGDSGARILEEMGSRRFIGFFTHMDNKEGAYAKSAPKLISKQLYNRISATDIRRDWWDPSDKESPYVSKKFSFANVASFLGDYIYMRVEEMYFTAAEAALRLDDLKSARELMNTVMAERDPGYSANNRSGTLLGATTTTWTGSFLENILTHRRIELWGEYGRLFDVRRLGQGIDRRTDDGFSEECISMMNRRNVNITKADTYDWVLTIPKAELDANPNINEEDQNP